MPRGTKRNAAVEIRPAPKTASLDELTQGTVFLDVNGLFQGLQNYQTMSGEKEEEKHRSMIRSFVEDCDTGVLCHSSMQNPKLHRLVTDVCENKYNVTRAAKESKIDAQEFKDRYEWKRLRTTSYTVGLLCRHRSEHHVPAEHLLLAIASRRSGIAKRTLGFMTDLHLTISAPRVDKMIQYFIEHPFKIHASGRIGLGVYDNCSYSRKFVFERVGDHEEALIHTTNSLEIPIGFACDTVGPDTKVWRPTQHDVYKQFDPHSQETANAWRAVWSTIFPVLKGPCKGGLDHKAWNYPYVKEEGNVPVCCMPQHIPPMQDLG